MIETILDFLTSLPERGYILITVIIIIIFSETIARLIKKKMKRSIFSRYDQSTDPKHGEYYLDYYRKSQVIDIIRVIVFIFGCFVLISSRTDHGFNLFVVAAGAFIIIFKDLILSIVAFFFVLRGYTIGDTIGIGEAQGQIIFIRLLTIGILGKDSDGDSTGKLFVIPSYKFLTENTRKEDLHTDSIRKEMLRIPFKTQDFGIDFTTFSHELTGFLDTLLPVMTRKNCGNYQTYIGYRYKMDIDYLEDKCIIITIGIVGKWESAVLYKRDIIEFVESKRIHFTK